MSKFVPVDPCINSRGIYQLSWEDQKRLASWNWKAIGLLADELAKRRFVTLSLPEADREDDIQDSFNRYLP